jgi:hypothetical protein
MVVTVRYYDNVTCLYEDAANSTMIMPWTIFYNDVAKTQGVGSVGAPVWKLE